MIYNSSGTSSQGNVPLALFAGGATRAPAGRPRRRLRVAAVLMSTEVLSHRAGLAGKCSDAGHDGWFPVDPEPSEPAELAAYEDYARQACAGCPVMGECLELVLRDESRPGAEAHGIAGGLAPWERTALAGARRAVAS
jgi:hypothetical protein